MFRSMRELAMGFWADDAGSVIATEYLALGTIVALGSVAGLQAVRDGMNAEMQEYGSSVRNLRQQYHAPGMKMAGNIKQGSEASDHPCVGGVCP